MIINYHKLIGFIFYLFIFVLFLSNSFNYLDPDFGWHLKIGQEIFLDKEIPWEENHNFTLEGKTWVDHEWLLNLVSYIIYTKFGYFFLSVIFAVIPFITFYLLNNYLIKKLICDKLHFVLILAIEMIALAGILPHSGIRMQEFSVLFLLLQLLIINKFQKTDNNKILFLLPVLFAIWANVHGGFMIGLVILCLYFFLAIFSPFLIKYLKIDYLEFKYLTKKQKQYLFIALLLSFVSVFATPYHYKYFSFMFSYTNTYYMKKISEWLPAYSQPIIYSQQIYYIIFVLNLIFLYVNRKIAKINLWHLSLSLLLFISAFTSRRNFPLFFIGSIPLITSTLSSFNAKNFKNLYFLVYNKYINLNIVFVLSLSIFLLLLIANFTDTPFQNKKFCTSFPCEALKSIKELPQSDLKTFNDYGSGGYLIWNWPDQKIFIDGRLPMLTVNNHSLLEEYYEFFDKDKISEKLKQHDINLVLGKKYKPVIYNWFEKFFLGLKDDLDQSNPQQEYLNKTDDWSQIFSDDNFFVYFKAQE